MPRNYVDNAYNRSLGRVGMPVGSAVVSRSSMSGSSSTSNGSSRTYVDNASNRSLGRVGMPVGSHVVSRSSTETSSNHTSEPRTYVDNASNRSLGRVGLPIGSAVVSSSSSETSSSPEPRTYVDNASNRSLGRVGMPVGSHVVSRSSNGTSSGYTSEPRTYVDNASNRSLGRVGLPIGSAVVSTSKVDKSLPTKCYVDNAFNRRLGRVGLPLGTAQTSSSTYVDNALNRKLNRVGKPIGSTVYRPNKQKKPKGVCKQLYDFDPEDPNIIGLYNNLQREMEENENNPEIYYEYEKALGIIHRHDAALTMARSENLGKLNWLQSGEIIEYSDLEVGDRIGSGGFGDVHIAVWQQQYLVVVKKLRVRNVHEKKKRQFQEEVKVLSSLNHPCIVQFYGACIKTPNLAIVMEFMSGGSLHDALHVECRILTMASKLDMTEDILSALQYIHGQDVSHRDIKAMNVLLNEALTHCKLGDFGLALKESMESSASVANHAAVGTIRYSSPEILRGDRLTQVDCKAADIYAASITINELFIEEEPFYGLNQHQLRKAVESGERPEPSNDNELRVPELLKPLLEQGMADRKSERPQASVFFKMFVNIIKPTLLKSEQDKK